MCFCLCPVFHDRSINETSRYAEDESENTDPNYALLIEDENVVQGTLTEQGEMRWYGFILEQRAKASIMLQLVSNVDADIYLFKLNQDRICGRFCLNMRISARFFLRTAVEQRHQALCLYASLQKKCMLLHNAAETLYSEYKNLCSEKLLDEQDFPRMEQFAALKMQHRAENWEIANSNSLVRSYLKEYMQLMIKDDSLCVGAIMEAAAQMRRVTQGIGEMVNYLQYNRDILFSDSRDDIFHLFFAMAVQQSQKKQDISEIKKRLLNMVDVMTKLDVYDKKQMAEAHELCENYDFTKESEGRINIMREDCIAHIMEYAGYGSDMIRDFHSIVQQYRELPDMMSTDNEARQLRREITKVFYDIYTKAFMRSVEELVKPSQIMMMFFNFGFMDAEVLGETNTKLKFDIIMIL